MKSISQNPPGSQIPAPEDSGLLPIRRPQPVDGDLADAVICLRPVDGLEFEPLESLPPVDWSNITKDPRLEDLEAFEMHVDTCRCAACFRAVARMSNHPELAALSVS